MTQQFKTMDVLRLEVQQDPTGLYNLVDNPSGELGAYGWISPVAGSQLIEDDLGDGVGHLRYVVAGNAANWFYTEPLRVDAGQYAAARWDQITSIQARVRFEWLDASKAPLSSSTQSAYFSGGGVGVYQPKSYAAQQAPAGTKFARLRYDIYRTTAGDNPFPGNLIRLRQVTVAKAATAAELTGLTYLPPAPYLNILGPTHTLVIDRAELNLGTLSAEVLDATIDPSQSKLIRPGRRVRVTAYDGSAWSPLFTGKVSNGRVKYDNRRGDAKRARITLTAVDAVSQLAQVPAADGVASIADLPFVLEGAGVPWNVNGSRDQVRSATVVSRNDSAKTIDQVAVTRDSELGYAWVDRAGVLQVWDRASVSTAVTALLTASDYSEIDVDYDTDRCINTVTVKLLRTNLADGQTVEVPYGPFVDEPSADEWGPHQAEFTVQGIADTTAAAKAYADQILTANATPVVRVNSVILPVFRTTDIAPDRALIDLYDRVRVVSRPYPLGNILPNGGLEPNGISQPTEVYTGAFVDYVTDEKHSGTTSVRVGPDGNDYRGLIFWSGTDYAFDIYPAAQIWVGSAWVKGPAGRAVTIGFRWRGPASAYLGEGEGQRQHVLNGAWQRIYTDPARRYPDGDSTPDNQPGLQIRSDPSGWQPGEYFWIDDVQIEPGEILTPFAQRSWTPVLSDIRVAGVKHTIAPDKWITELSFAALGGVASPQAVPSAPGGSAIPTASIWQDLTHAGTGGNVRYAVVNGHVTVQVNAAIAIGAGADVTLVDTGNALPVGLRPSQGPYAAIFSGNNIGWFQVTPVGSIVVHASTGAMATVGGTVTYPLG